MLELILFEISKFLFIASCIFILYVIGTIGIRVYSKFKLGNDTKVHLSKTDRISLLISLAIFICFLL